MAIDKEMKRLQTMLDKKESRDYDIQKGWQGCGDKADGLSRIAFCLRYGKKFSSLVDSLEKSLSRYQSHDLSKEPAHDITTCNNTEKDTSQGMSLPF